MVKEKKTNVFLKTTFKLIKEKYIRFILNILIVLISVSLTAGIGSLEDAYAPGYASNFIKGNAPDVILKYVPDEGETKLWTDERIAQVNQIQGVKKITSLLSIDAKDETSENFRIQIYKDIKEDNGLALPELVEGEYPTNPISTHTIDDKTYNVFEALLLQGIDGKRNHNIGDIIKMDKAFQGMPFAAKIVGFANNTLNTSKQKERAASEEEYYLDNIYYSSFTVFGFYANFFTPSDLYVSLEHTGSYLTDTYKSEINAYKGTIEGVFAEKVKVLTLEENTSYALYKSYTNKINIISIIFPFFFVAVCTLVVVIIMSRLIADDRSAIACSFSLGVPTKKIYGKYLFYSLLSSFIGAIGGYILGCLTLPTFIAGAYKSTFKVQYVNYDLYSLIGIITVVLVMISTFLVTFYSTKKTLKETPAELLKPKAPKAGKKVLLEKIPLIWNRLSFSFKNSVRNIFRHKKNLILTSLSVIGSTVLVFLGLGLRDIANHLKNDALFGNVAGSIGFISIIIVLYGAVLSALIIYALSSMNIDEREREIAVLKVLGYKDWECSLFISRELILITVFAALIGIPVSMLAAYGAFGFLDFGSLWDIKWYTYIITYAVIIVTSLISSIILRRKIYKIDFNISLKSLE